MYVHLLVSVRSFHAVAFCARRATIKRIGNALIGVDDVEAGMAFFVAQGMKLEGETTVEGA